MENISEILAIVGESILLLVILIVFTVMIVFAVHGLLMIIIDRGQVRKSWMFWVPLLNYWVIGKAIGEVRVFGKIRVPHMQWMIFILPAIYYGVILLLGLFGGIGGMITMIGFGIPTTIFLIAWFYSCIGELFRDYTNSNASRRLLAFFFLIGFCVCGFRAAKQIKENLEY